MDVDEGQSGWVPAACTLPTAEAPVRVAEFDALFSEAVEGVERVGPHRLRLTLAPGPDVAARAADLAARETGCCSFFTFTLSATGGALWLDAVVPDGQVAVVDGLAARARHAASRAT